jgi:hypothetical protein
MAARAWIAVFTVLGLASFGWNSKLTYSGNQFGELWDITSFRDTYRVASQNGLPVDPSLVKSELLDMLRRFGGPYYRHVRTKGAVSLQSLHVAVQCGVDIARPVQYRENLDTALN